MPIIRLRPVGRLASVVAPALFLALPACSGTPEEARPDAPVVGTSTAPSEDKPAEGGGISALGAFASALVPAAPIEPPKAGPTPAPAPSTSPIQPPAPVPKAAPAVEPAQVASAAPVGDREPAQAESTGSDPKDAPKPALAPAVAEARPAATAGRPLNTAEIVEKCEPSVALVQGKMGSGTGFLVGPGLLATNSHVVDDEFLSTLEIRFPSAPEKSKGPVKAALLYEDPNRDLAILALKTDLPTLEVAPSYNFRKGEDITVIGNPGMGDDAVLENAISRGIMSTKTTIDNKAFYQLNIAINPGNSGGPVFDSMGRVIGVATLKSAKQEGMAFCIPVDDLNAALAKVKAAKPGTSVDGAASKHRALAAFKRLSAGGALLAVGLDVHRAAIGRQGFGLQIGEKRLTLADFDKVLADLDGKAFGPAVSEAQAMKNDTGLAPSKRENLARLAANYAAMRAMIAQPGGDANAFAGRARGLKQNHARLVEDLGKALDAEVPDGLLSTLRSENVSDPGTTLAGLGSQRSAGGMGSPFNSGARARADQRRNESQRRIQDMRDRADQRRQQLQDRMRGRR